MQAMKVNHTPRKKQAKWRKRDLAGWLIMLPGVFLFAFFVWEPLLENIRLSLSTAKLYTITGFAGMDNYISALKDVDFQAAFTNTFSYTLWSLLIGFFIPILLAILIMETVHLKSLFRIAVYFPNIMPALATIWIWSYFFMPGKTGVLNIIFGGAGLGPFEWLNNVHWTIPLIVVTMTWKSAGSTALIYMASISGISPDLYEAATIDGAGVMSRIRHITLPGLKGIATTMLILQVISVFQILYEPMVLKNGGPNNASISLMMLMYRYGYRDFNIPKAAALSVMICVMLVILSGVYMKVTAKKED
jgi:multiple sugar transport system permease protein